MAPPLLFTSSQTKNRNKPSLTMHNGTTTTQTKETEHQNRAQNKVKCLPTSTQTSKRRIFFRDTFVSLADSSSHAVSLLNLNDTAREKLLQANTSSTQNPAYEQEAKGTRSKMDGAVNKMDG